MCATNINYLVFRTTGFQDHHRIFPLFCFFMAAVVAACGTPAAAVRATESVSSPATPGVQTETNATAIYEKVLRYVYRKEDGYAYDPEKGGKRVGRVCCRLRRLVLKGEWGEIELTPERAMHILMHVRNVKIEEHGWLQDAWHNHRAHAGHTLAIRMKDEALNHYVGISQNGTSLSQEDIRNHRVQFYEGVFNFEAWMFRRAPKSVTIHRSDFEFRTERWDYMAGKCGFTKTLTQQEVSANSEFTVDNATGLITIHDD